MTVSMLLFWALVIAGVVLVRYLGDRGPQMSNAQPASRTPAQMVAERFAHGGIDDEEYRQRAEVLRNHVNS